MPNTDATASHQVYQVDNVTLSAPLQPEVKNFTMNGVNQTGIIQLGLVRMDGLKISYDQKTNVTYGCTADQFKTALETFDSYKNKLISVTRHIYDAADNVLPDLTGAAKIDYQVSIELLRSTLHQGETFASVSFNGFTGTFAEAAV